RFQTDPFFRNTVGNELAQRFGADEIAILADRLGDGPQDAGADWIDLVGKVLAVEAKPGFKPQTIAGGKPDPHDPFVGEKFLSESLAFGYRQGDLEPVLTRVAGTRDERIRSRLCSSHECERCNIETGILVNVVRCWSLMREQLHRQCFELNR